ADEGLVTADEIKNLREAQRQRLYAVYDEAQRDKQQYQTQELSTIPAAAIPTDRPSESPERETLNLIVDRITAFPADFHVHPKLTAFLKKRREALGGPIDWALAEVLAFGSLVLEGTPVRLSGEDSGRGTFSQRHVEYHDAENDRVHVPLQHLSQDQARF